MNERSLQSDQAFARRLLEGFPQRDYYERVLKDERRKLRWTCRKLWLAYPLAALHIPGCSRWLMQLQDLCGELRYGIEEDLSCLAAIDDHGYPFWGGFAIPMDHQLSPAPNSGNADQS